MRDLAAVLIAAISALLLSVCFVTLLAYKEVQLQYESFQQAHANVMQCRENLAYSQSTLSVDKYCGQIPIFSNVVPDEVSK